MQCQTPNNLSVMAIKNGIYKKSGVYYKSCTKCAKDKPLEEFSIKRCSKKRGHKYVHRNEYCKSCEELYKKMDIPLEERVENKFDDITYYSNSFIYNAF